MEPGNPFAVLSLIAAPAILTNSAAVLIMSTGTRLGRAVDRARELSKQLEDAIDPAAPTAQRRLRELGLAEARAIILVQALRGYYTALGSFASATLFSLLGAVLVSIGVQAIVPALEVLAAVAGVIAVGALVAGSVLLVRETRIAVQSLRDRAADVRARTFGGGPTGGATGAPSAGPAPRPPGAD
jgi:hypothetical protein